MNARIAGLLVVAIYGTSIGGHASGGQTSAGATAVPPDLAKRVKTSIALGREIFRQDSACAIATDILASRLGTLEGRGLAGYVAVPDESNPDRRRGWQVLFYSGERDPRVLHKVHVPLGGTVPPTYQRVDPPEALPGSIAALVRARETAIAAEGPFDTPINPVILPGAAIGVRGIVVYLLAGTNSSDIVVLGRHTRVVVSPDGRKVSDVFPMSKGRLELPMAPPGNPAAAALYVTNTVTDYPLETHVFASLQHSIPILVATRRGVWRVDGDAITLVSSGPPGSAGDGAGPVDPLSLGHPSR